MTKFVFRIGDRRVEAESKGKALELCGSGAVPIDSVVEIHRSTGTSVVPIVHDKELSRAVRIALALPEPPRRLPSVDTVVSGTIALALLGMLLFVLVGEPQYIVLKGVVGMLLFIGFFYNYHRKSREIDKNRADIEFRRTKAKLLSSIRVGQPYEDVLKTLAPELKLESDAPGLSGSAFVRVVDFIGLNGRLRITVKEEKILTVDFDVI